MEHSIFFLAYKEYHVQLPQNRKIYVLFFSVLKETVLQPPHTERVLR